MGRRLEATASFLYIGVQSSSIQQGINQSFPLGEVPRGIGSHVYSIYEEPGSAGHSTCKQEITPADYTTLLFLTYYMPVPDSL